MKRGKTSLSIALKGKKLKAAKAERSNPGKKALFPWAVFWRTFWVFVVYRHGVGNGGVAAIAHGKLLDSINKKKKRKALSFKLNTKLKVKVKGRKVYYKTKKGKTKFIRMSTVAFVWLQ